jgi:hypothetical protein
MKPQSADCPEKIICYDRRIYEPCTEDDIYCYGPYADYNFAAPENVLVPAIYL